MTDPRGAALHDGGRNGATDPRYRGYLDRISKMIKEKWSYPCLKDEGTGRCDYKPARLTIEFALLQDGRVDYIRVTKKAEWKIYDEYAVTRSITPLRSHRYRPR
jgi:hypothetical protein